MDGTSSVPMTDMAQGRVCQAFISGFIKGLQYAKDDPVCADAASVGTLMRVYVLYMEQNPEKMDEPKEYGLTSALTSRYACPSYIKSITKQPKPSKK
jgi:hypothetical protein